MVYVLFVGCGGERLVRGPYRAAEVAEPDLWVRPLAGPRRRLAYRAGVGWAVHGAPPGHPAYESVVICPERCLRLLEYAGAGRG